MKYFILIICLLLLPLMADGMAIRRSLADSIGLNLIRKYITEVNFDTHTLSLYTFGNHIFSGERPHRPAQIAKSYHATVFVSTETSEISQSE